MIIATTRNDKEPHQEVALCKRVKKLLKDAGNKSCSECRSSKPTQMALFTRILAKEGHSRGTRKFGIFCCDSCSEYMSPLVAQGICQIKSLKKAENWSENDVDTLEKSGNHAVSAVYEAKLQGNHSDKQKGTLASAGFMSMKYKDCIFYCEEAYREQLSLHDKNEGARATEDLVKKALIRQDTIKNLLAEEDCDSSRSTDPTKAGVKRGVGERRERRRPKKMAETTAEASNTRPTLNRASSVDRGLAAPRRSNSRRQLFAKQESERISTRWNRGSFRRSFDSSQALISDDNEIDPKPTTKRASRRDSSSRDDLHRSRSSRRVVSSSDQKKAPLPASERRKKKSSSARKLRIQNNDSSQVDAEDLSEGPFEDSFVISDFGGFQKSTRGSTTSSSDFAASKLSLFLEQCKSNNGSYLLESAVNPIHHTDGVESACESDMAAADSVDLVKYKV